MSEKIKNVPNFEGLGDCLDPEKEAALSSLAYLLEELSEIAKYPEKEQGVHFAKRGKKITTHYYTLASWINAGSFLKICTKEKMKELLEVAKKHPDCTGIISTFLEVKENENLVNNIIESRTEGRSIDINAFLEEDRTNHLATCTEISGQNSWGSLSFSESFNTLNKTDLPRSLTRLKDQSDIVEFLGIFTDSFMPIVIFHWLCQKGKIGDITDIDLLPYTFFTDEFKNFLRRKNPQHPALDFSVFLSDDERTESLLSDPEKLTSFLSAHQTSEINRWSPELLLDPRAQAALLRPLKDTKYETNLDEEDWGKWEIASQGDFESALITRRRPKWVARALLTRRNESSLRLDETKLNFVLSLVCQTEIGTRPNPEDGGGELACGESVSKIFSSIQQARAGEYLLIFMRRWENNFTPETINIVQFFIENNRYDLIEGLFINQPELYEGKEFDPNISQTLTKHLISAPVQSIDDNFFGRISDPTIAAQVIRDCKLDNETLIKLLPLWIENFEENPEPDPNLVLLLGALKPAPLQEVPDVIDYFIQSADLHGLNNLPPEIKAVFEERLESSGKEKEMIAAVTGKALSKVFKAYDEDFNNGLIKTSLEGIIIDRNFFMIIQCLTRAIECLDSTDPCSKEEPEWLKTVNIPIGAEASDDMSKSEREPMYQSLEQEAARAEAHNTMVQHYREIAEINKESDERKKQQLFMSSVFAGLIAECVKLQKKT